MEDAPVKDTTLHRRFKKAAARLEAHQQRVVDKMEDRDGLLVYHGMGSGKTLTALAVAEKLKRPATVIGPAGLKHNFAKERDKHKIKADVDYYSYSAPPEEGTVPLLVFDEAQRMGRLESQRSHLVDTRKGEKTLLETGTPINNEPAEIIPILRALGVDIPRDTRAFNAQFIQEVQTNPSLFARVFRGVKPGTTRQAKNLEEFRALVAGKVDYHETGQDHFPSVTEEEIRVPMSSDQGTVYNFVLGKNPSLAYKVRHRLPPSKTEAKQLNAFLSGTRQISNTPVGFSGWVDPRKDAPKIQRAVEQFE